MYNSIIKRLSSTYNPIVIVAVQNLIAAFYFFPLFFLLDYQEFKQLTIGWEQLYPLLMLGVLASSVAFILSVYTVKTLGMNRASVFSTLVPVTTASFAFFLGVEDLTAMKMLGIGCVIGGLILSQATLKKRSDLITKQD